MENNVVLDPAVEDTLLYSPGRVKRGLLWLESEEAEGFGLSLDLLIERVVLNPLTSEKFNLSYSPTCAIGYASEHRSRYYPIHEEKGDEWMQDNGFFVETSDIAPYNILTEGWRIQLQALVDEGGRA